ELEVNVICNHEVYKSVAVVIAEGGSSGPTAVGYSGLLRYVGERSIADVLVKHIPAQAGDIHFGPAIVVVVADGSAHGEAGGGYPGLVCYVSESAVMVVVEESASGFFAFEGHVDSGRVGEIDVGPAVAVVIDDDDAAAHGFDDVLLFRRGEMLEIDPG